MQTKAVLVAVLASLAIAAPGYPHRRGAERAVRPRGPSYPTTPPPADSYPVNPLPPNPYPVSPPSSEAAPGGAYPVTRTTAKAPSTTTRTITKPFATPSSTTTTLYRTTTIPPGYPQSRPTMQPFHTLPLPEGYPQGRPTTKTTPGYSLRPTQSASPPPPTKGGKAKNKSCGSSLPMCCETTLMGLAGATCKPCKFGLPLPPPDLTSGDWPRQNLG